MHIISEVAISRDPFARSDTMRGLVAPEDRGPCEWCGSRPGRFVYWEAPDGLRSAPPPRAYAPTFCGKGCHDSYNL